VADAPLDAAALDADGVSRRPAVGYALILSAVVLWALNAAVAKVVIDSGGISALRLAEVRSTGSALVLFSAVALLRPVTLWTTRRELGFLVLFGVAGLACVHFLYFVAITHLDIGIALVIQYLAPVLIALWARFFVHEPVRRRLWLALALALAGLSLVVDLWSGVSLDGIGVAASLGTAVAFAGYVLMADHSLRRGRDPYSLLAWGFLFAALFWAVVQPWWGFPAGLVTEEVSLLGRLEEVQAPVWLLLASLVLLGTVVPFVLLLHALHHVPPTRATIVAMAEPVLGGLVGFLWLRQELAGLQIAGGILVLAAILLAQTARPVRGH
jgi:drug/metabolite transporter (DMT)-like permease